VTLELRRVSIALGPRVLIPPFDLTVAPGEVVTLMGPSGSGKSSLLAYLTGHLAPALAGSGSVRLDGVEITGRPAHRRGLGILFQDDLLFPHLSVGGNLLFGLARAVTGRAARRAAVEAALEQVELAGSFDADVATLSGGQRARVALLRAMLAQPRALLLDEPFGRLDVPLRTRMRELVRLMSTGIPVLLVTHDVADVSPDGRVISLRLK